MKTETEQYPQTKTNDAVTLCGEAKISVGRSSIPLFVPNTFVNSFSTRYRAAITSLNRPSKTNVPASRRCVIMSSAVEEKGAGMRLIKGAEEALIGKMGCRSWGKWGCGPSTFPWTYSDDEVCLVLTGDFTVIPDDGGETMGKFCFVWSCLWCTYFVCD